MRRNRRDVLAGLACTMLPLRAAAESPKGLVTLQAADGKLRLAPAPAAETAVWAFAGTVPGPLLRVRKGELLEVRLVNRLARPLSLCWHGVRIVNAMDGVAGLTQPPVAPGGSFDYRFVPPDAGLYWYHPHVFPFSAEEIGRGLYGALIVDEAEPPQVDQDLLLVLDDWSLDAAGRISGDFLDPVQARGAGRIGAFVTVNSKPVPLAAEARP
ncbi:MAG: multicopper oxidase domain-containing protein, partial [Caulobacteraceae bacterium]|nr:multicopper oxidase domain-containing protein [Caulobacter sp.]